MKTFYRKSAISKFRTSSANDFFLDSNEISAPVHRIVGNDIVLQSFEIDKRTGQLFIRKGASLDVNHLNGESIVFSVEVNNKWLRDICLRP